MRDPPKIQQESMASAYGANAFLLVLAGFLVGGDFLFHAFRSRRLWLGVALGVALGRFFR